MAQNNGYLNPFVCVCVCMCVWERTFNIHTRITILILILLPGSRDSSFIDWEAETLK